MKHDADTNSSHHINNRNDISGSYDPGPADKTDGGDAELSTVQVQSSDIMLEEFPDGPYGATTNAPFLGKSTPWLRGQVAISAFRDQNPVESNRQTPRHEPSADASRGSIEGQN